MALRDLQAFLEDDGLEYPLRAASFGDAKKFPNGKTYKVPSPDAKTGLWLTAMADLGTRAALAQPGDVLSPDDVATLKLDDDEEKSLYRRVLGPVYDEMVADGVKWSVLKAVAQDAYLCFAMSTDLADAALQSLGKARANRSQRRAAATAGRRSAPASGGTATRTRRRASTGSSTSPTAPEAAETG